MVAWISAAGVNLAAGEFESVLTDRVPLHIGVYLFI